MDPGEESVATGIDALLELVEKRGRVSLKEAAKELGQPESVIESWGSALRDEGMVGVEYNIHGEMILVKIEQQGSDQEDDIDEEEVEKRVQQHIEEHEQLVRELKKKLGIREDEQVPRELIEQKMREIRELKEKIERLEKSIEELRRVARGEVQTHY